MCCVTRWPLWFKSQVSTLWSFYIFNRNTTVLLLWNINRKCCKYLCLWDIWKKNIETVVKDYFHCIFCLNCILDVEKIKTKELITCLFKIQWSSTQYTKTRAEESVVIAILMSPFAWITYWRNQQQHLPWWVPATAATERWSSLYSSVMNNERIHITQKSMVKPIRWRILNMGPST